MGYEYGDAQNMAVRCFLYQFSKNFELYEDGKHKKRTLEYFNYKCPYTGELLTENNMVKDHIVPMNKESCGLHVFGNVIYVTKQANSQKSSKTLEEYLDNPERLATVQKFIQESGYQKIKDKYTEYLQKTCHDLYQEVGEIIKTKQKSFPEEQRTNINFQKSADCPKINSTKTYKFLDKKQIKILCHKNGFKIRGYFTKSSKNSAADIYWANPNIKYLHYDWTLVLDDYYNNIIYCLYIPANSIKESQIFVRKDKPYQIDLQIQYGDPLFRDRRSKIVFSKWLIKQINY